MSIRRESVVVTIKGEEVELTFKEAWVVLHQLLRKIVPNPYARGVLSPNVLQRDALKQIMRDFQHR